MNYFLIYKNAIKICATSLKHVWANQMATGCDFSFDDLVADHRLDHDDDDDDNEQEQNTTETFDPSAASTPISYGEEKEMQRMSHVKSGIPDTFYTEPT